MKSELSSCLISKVVILSFSREVSLGVGKAVVPIEK